jgi:transcriptional regulator
MGREPKRVDVLQGTLDLLVLRVLKNQELHGWAIADRIQHHSGQALEIGEGSLYPALYRLEARGWVASEWGTSENNRRAKFYTLTVKGRAQLRVEAATWTRFAHAVFAALEAPPQPA